MPIDHLNVNNCFNVNILLVYKSTCLFIHRAAAIHVDVEVAITSTMYLTIMLFVIFLYFYQHYRKRRPNGLQPPGPKGLPFLGNIFDIKRENVHLSIDQLFKQYGSVFQLNFPSERFIVLNSPDAFRAAFLIDPAATYFSDRPPLFAGKKFFCNQNDIVWSRSGYHQTKLRNITHRLLRTYGEGINHMERIVEIEIRETMVNFENMNSASFDPSLDIHTFVCNTICVLLIGRTYTKEDREIKCMTQFALEVNKLLAAGINSVLPFMQYFPPFRRIVTDALKHRNDIIDFFIVNARKELNENNTRGIVDELLLNPDLTEEDVIAIVLNLVTAGTLTTYGAIMCLLLNLLNLPDVQEKIQGEIDDVIGTGRLPAFLDRHNMPYTEAVMLESLRYSSHLPLGGGQVKEDITFMGFSIQKHTKILTNFWSLHHDPNVWGDPWNFRPERFLDGNGMLLRADHPLMKSLMTFGIGKRSCIGEMVARIRMFLFTTTLLQKFHLVAGDTSLPSSDPRTYKGGLLLMPHPYTMRVMPRK